MSTLKTWFDFFVISLFSLFMFFQTACTQHRTTDPENKGSDSKSAVSENTQTQVVNLSIWGGYISEDVQKDFEAQTGIKIKISNFSSNEELLAKVQMGGAGIDVAVPSDYMVDIMSKLDLLLPINKSKIENFNSILPQFLSQDFDPKNTFSIPYSWAITGIAVNRDLYKEPITSWKDIYDNPHLSGKLALLDDPREVTGSALKRFGYSVNTINAEEIKKAREILLRNKKNVKIFTSNSVDILINKEVAVAQAYSSDANQAIAKSNGKIEFIIPSEGGVRSIDNLVILKSSKNTEQAHKLINYLTNVKVNAALLNKILLGPVLKGTRDLLPKALQNNKILFPDPSTLERLERLKDLGDNNKIYEDLWTEVKSN